MKKVKVLFYVLMFLPLALTLISLVLLPDRIPSHYDIMGNIDAWGSKYLNLLFPAFTVLMGLFFVLMGRGYARKGDAGQEKILLLAGCGALVVFNVMTMIFLWQAYQVSVEHSAAPLQISRVLFAVTGLALIVLGNVMPKLRRNGLIGLRTAWSMENDENWRKGQVAGGIGLIATGALMTVGNVFFVAEEWSIMFSTVCLLVMIPVYLIVLSRLKR